MLMKPMLCHHPPLYYNGCDAARCNCLGRAEGGNVRWRNDEDGGNERTRDALLAGKFRKWRLCLVFFCDYFFFLAAQSICFARGYYTSATV